MTAAPFTTRRLWIGLGVSILLNMFLAGMFVAHFSLDHRSPRRTPPSPAARQAFRSLFSENKEEMRALRQQVRQARTAVHSALIAEPFDKAELKQALDGLRSATGTAQNALHGALLEVAPKLSLEERTALSRAHRLWGGRPNSHRHRHHPRPRNRGPEDSGSGGRE